VFIPPLPVHDPGDFGAEASERLGHRTGPLRGEDAGELAAHPRRIGQRSQQVEDRAGAQLDARPVVSIVVLRVLLQTVPALNYALAMSGVKFRDYLVGTLLGLPLPIALYCVFFDYLARVLKVPGY
jgi:hypothetical protein